MNETEQLRNEILEKTKAYFRLAHAPKLIAPFDKGRSRVNYAGRVFDEAEMVNLVDSALEFWLTYGRYSKTFEKRLADYLGVRWSLLVNSGSSANLLAFMALTSPLLRERQVKRGDEVITVAAAFPTTVAPIVQYGAVPVFVDVELETANVDVALLEAARSEKTKAVMLAHTLGNPFNIEKVRAFCNKYNLWLIEDNCDALGSEWNVQKTGTFGDISTSSFYPPHHMTMGEGGAVYTNNPLLKKILLSIRDWGRDCWCESGVDNTCGARFSRQFGTLPKGYDHKYVYSHFGYNLKATDMQAAVGVAQLEKLDGFTAARRKNFAHLKEGLQGLEHFFILPKHYPKANPSWFGFLIILREETPFTRNEIVGYLEKNRIQTRNLFAGNITRQPLFDVLDEGKDYRIVGDLANTDRLMNDAFWLGVYPGMSEEMIDYMVSTIRDFCSGYDAPASV
ncbi:lipopolysaccharide biosynthesis protein RfbH [Nitratifractor salsuginis]|uniref:DegT/DnrJ/EryC1/StrS aminotransferase n=1 Tax=Nitratifractor salsuginis (strain DSM 16511 / JCM 12458 / E9I37-1) TaxID=749222 RepID=E6X2Z6_NITSE|nr:lipopolysaccharide biosynthesis protein RfbH [Nitratifractor salsuginis]ADV47279.1 DegT/DnrJ/EryC1/StrS aminotransferase [Nitratifractor salsuginis DSM 16511]